jgi:hypothetical protein
MTLAANVLATRQLCFQCGERKCCNFRAGYLVGERMGFCRASLFRKRQFTDEIIVTYVRWYLLFSLSLRDVEELMAERAYQ